MGSQDGRPSVLLFPWLAYGHIVPFVGLAKKLSDKGFVIRICSTAINLTSIKTMIPQKYSNSIHLVELLLPAADFPELPPHYHTANGLPLHLYDTLRKAFRMSKPCFTNIMKTLSPNLVIYDFINLWAEGIAHALQVPAVRFYISSAASYSFFSHFVRNAPGVTYPFPAIRLKPYELKPMLEISGDVKCGKDPDENWMAPQEIVLVSSSREIEAKYMDYMSELIKSKIVAVPVASIVEVQTTNADADVEILDWLGKKAKGSTVFVSFGSEYFLTVEDMEEIAYALELSNVNFIWVLRFRKGMELTAEKVLPNRFLDRVKDKGRVIEGWAPQALILNHPSIGAFVSQCGWNSVLEGINFGVPIIALPGHLEQPVNARSLVDMGVAVEIKREDNGKLRREEMARAIVTAVSEESEGTLRKNMKKMSEDLRLAREEEIEIAIQELEKLITM